MSFISTFWQFVSQKIRPYVDVDMNGKKINGLPTASYPTEDSQAATKKYHDDNPGGVSDHAELTNVTANQHHPQAHSLASHSTKAHSELTGVTHSQHHTKFTTAEHDTTTRHPVSVIKTATGSSSSTIAGYGVAYFTLHRKSFFPQITTLSSLLNVMTYSVGSDPNDYIGRFGIYNNNPGSYNYYVRWDYLSSSSPPQIWVIVNGRGKIICCWEADDPSNPDKPDISPIGIVCKDPNMQRELQTLKIKTPTDYKQMKKRADEKQKSLSHYILDEYVVNFKTKQLKKKE